MWHFLLFLKCHVALGYYALGGLRCYAMGGEGVHATLCNKQQEKTQHPIKPAFHDTDTDILIRILTNTSDARFPEVITVAS